MTTEQLTKLGITLADVNRVIKILTKIRKKHLKKNWRNTPYQENTPCPLCENPVFENGCKNCLYHTLYLTISSESEPKVPTLEDDFSVFQARRFWIDKVLLRKLKRIQRELQPKEDNVKITDKDRFDLLVKHGWTDIRERLDKCVKRERELRNIRAKHRYSEQFLEASITVSLMTPGMRKAMMTATSQSR